MCERTLVLTVLNENAFGRIAGDDAYRSKGAMLEAGTAGGQCGFGVMKESKPTDSDV